MTTQDFTALVVRERAAHRALQTRLKNVGSGSRADLAKLDAAWATWRALMDLVREATG